MKRAIQLLAIGASFVFAGILAFDALGQQPDPPDKYVQGQIIVKISDSTPPHTPSGLLSMIDATFIRRFESTGAELWGIGDMAVEEAVDRLKSNPQIEYVEPDYIWRAVATFPNDPDFAQLWGLHNTGQTGGTPDADVDTPEAWDVETGDSVLVGVIDTGVDWNHADLSENIYVNPGEIPGNNIDDDGNGYIDDVRGWDFVNNDNNPMDDAGHGTHVSGTIAAVGNNGIGVVGVSWRAKILPIKFLDSYGGGSTSNAIRSVEYATLMGVRLTNNSWGGGSFSAALEDAIDAAGAAGQLFVAAAGNNGSNTDIYPHYPSAYDLDNIISVANTDHNDQLNYLSNWGLVSVDLGAPGTSIFSTLPGNSYGYGSGTSMSAPHVSGAVSLIWAAAPTMPHTDVKALILSSADSIPALGGKSVSGGRLNVFRVVSQLDSIPPAPVTDLAVVSTGSNTATLRWTATGDDSATGIAAAYDLRYSDSGIYWSNFDRATPVPNPPTPQPIGSSETFMVQGLDFNTTYHFAMKVSDDRGNISWLSNLPHGATLGIPHLMFFPDSLHDNLFTGGSATHTLTIANDAEGTLDFVFSGLPTWLTAHPANGRVYDGESMDVEMIYDATGLSGGNYAASIALETNDPSQPLTTIAVTLEVTDAPDISVSRDILDYGPHYTGTSATDTLQITNIGTEPLVVSGISADNPEFSFDASGFTLDPGNSRVLQVSFNPVSEGLILGALSIQSDDPDHPTFAVTLRGEGVPPPVISVSPDSLADSLFTGGTSTHTLTIGNTGGSNLEFEIEIEETEAVASVSTRVLVPPSSANFPRGTYPPSVGLAPISRDPRGDDRDPFEDSRAAAAALAVGGSAFATETQFQFATRFNLSVPEFLPNIGPFTSAIWAGDFGVGDNAFAYAITDFNQFTRIDTLDGTQTALGTIVPFGEEGWTGAALDPTDGQFYATSTDVYSSSLYRIDVDAVTATRVGPIGFGGIIAVAVDDLGDMYAHDIVTDQLVSIDKATGAGTAIGSLGFDANFGQGMAFDPVRGELYLAAFNNYTFRPELRIADRSTGATVLVGTLGSSDPGGTLQLGWVGIPGLGGALWLAADPMDGIVPPGASMELSVTFDAARLADEDLNANILVSSNDPVTPEMTVPAYLHATAAPHIVLSATSLDYGRVFVGAVVESTISVSNHGVDPLTVTILTPSHPDFSVNTSDFTLNPAQSRDVVVSFAPTQVVPRSATLTINSNDPDQGVVIVELAGEGLEPPVISLSPDSLSDDLFTGETSTQTLTISNSGGNDLTFDISIIAVEDALMASVGAGVGMPALGGTPVYSYEATAASSGDAENSLEPHQQGPTYRFEYTSPNPTLTVLYFSDLYSQQQRVGEQALVNLGVTFTGYVRDYSGFLADLASGDWDVVLYESAATVWGIAPLVDYVASGGTLISSYWAYDAVFASAMEASYVASLSAPLDVSKWTTHSIFSYPNAVPNLVAGPDDWWTDNGDRFDPAGTAAALAGYTAGTSAGQAAIILGNEGRTILNGMIFEDYLPIDSDADGKPDIVELVENEILSVGALKWLSADPVSGIVPPGASEDITITFDAARLDGRGYDAEILIANNDPLRPEVSVPAHLEVTAAPDIAVSDTLLDYGSVFIGLAPTDSLIVSNEGADLLTVTAVAVDGEDFAADSAGFVLDVGETRTLPVVFTPSQVGPRVGTITITSDDPDEGTVTVTLLGEGLEPPVISVSLDSLADSLFTGQSSTHTLTIANTGGNDLEWEARVTPPDTATQEYTLTIPSGELTNNGDTDGQVAPLGDIRTTAITAQLADLTDVQIMWDRSHGQYDTYGWQTIISDLVSRGAVVTENFMPITPELLVDFDIVWLVDMAPWASTEITALKEWVEMGGGLLFETDEAEMAANAILSALGAGIEYSFTSIMGGTTTNVYSHPTTEGVDSVYFTGPGASLSTVTAPAGRLVDDMNNIAAIAYSEVMGGRVVAITDEIFLDYGIGLVDNQLFGNQVVDWLASGIGWLQIEPVSGVVAPGATEDVDVVFDAYGLPGGPYDADIVVANNDPISPEVIVPAHMDVTAAPDIAVSDSLLDYGPVFIGLAPEDTLFVSNVGTVALTVTVTVDNADFTTDSTNFVVGIGEMRPMPVAFAPSQVGPSAGTLTITSDDPDEGTVTVALLGEGLEPPVISVSPDLLADSLFTGETSTHTLTVSNSGGNDLEWAVVAQFTEGAAVLQTSPTFESSGVRDEDKDADAAPAGRPDASEIFAFATSPGSARAAKTTSEGPPETTTSLEDILANLNDNFEGVIATIPNRFDFSEGETGYYISDGGGDMYDGGNYLYTDLSGYITYSNDLIVDSPYFGASGRYFTRKYPGLFVLVADMEAVDYFQISGNLGADGAGSADGAILGASIGGTDYLGFVKRVYNTPNPSVNHLIIVEESPTANHEFSTYTNDDYHRAFNLTGQRRVYYLLYAGTSGFYIDDDATLAIMETFLSSLGPRWAKVEPTSGTTGPGQSTDIEVTFDAEGLMGGLYDAHIVIANNDPISPEVIVPAHMDVTGAPDIALSDSLLDYGPLFIGATETDTVIVSNEGTDVLTVMTVTVDNADFTTDSTGFVVGIGEMRPMPVVFAPSQTGPRTGTMTITSNDPDEGTVTVALLGEGLAAPVISVSPDSLVDSLFTGEASTHTLTVANSGGNDLEWAIAVQFTEDGTVLQTSPTFETSAVRDEDEDVDAAPAGRLDASEIFAFVASPGAEVVVATEVVAEGSAAYVTPLEDIRANLNDNYLSVVARIPNLYHFSGGETGIGISDGGEDMYDGGNYLWTDLGGLISYSNTLIMNSVYFGAGGRYFTRKYPGLFVLVADMEGVDYFQITGNLGADGYGSVDGAILETTIEGVRYLGFVKRVFNAPNPSVNHLIIVEESPTANHAFATNTNDDYHQVFNLTGQRRIYYLLYAGWNGFYIDNNATLAIMETFLSSLGLAPMWVDVEPMSGTIGPGQSTGIEVTFDAADLGGGAYNANLIVTSNDPLQPVVTVPTHLHVTAVPDIALSDSLLDFGPVIIGVSRTLPLVVWNYGNDDLIVSGISHGNPDVTAAPSSFTVAAESHQTVQVTFDPTVSGALTGPLTITSNDPDEGVATVALTGEGLVAPEIAVDPDSLFEALLSNDVSTQTLTISNSGGSDLTFSISTLVTADSTAAMLQSVALGVGQLSPSDSTEGGSSVPWLSLDTVSGTVPPDSSQDVTVTLDATGLYGGVYTADIDVATNVPDTPNVVVPVELTVTGIPVIALADSVFDFGDVFIGYPETINLAVSNVGTEVLSVSDITSDQSEFSAAPTSFSVSPGGQQVVGVTVTPTSAGPLAGSLAILSNDPVRGSVTVAVSANALDPPVISASADSVIASVAPGATLLDTIIVTNTGGSELVWNVDITTSGSQSALGVPDVLFHGDHGGGAMLWSTIIGDITARGATVTENNDPITPSLLSGYDIAWFGDRATPFSASELTAINQWAVAGGSVLIEADWYPSVPVYTDLLGVLGVTITFYELTAISGPTANIYPHESTEGVNTLYLPGPDAILLAYGPNGASIFADSQGLPIGAYGIVGSGLAVAMSDQLMMDAAINLEDNRLFANRLFNWLGGGTNWLSVDPFNGTLAAGASVDLEITLDASFLAPGVYSQNIDILSNDPASPTLTIAVAFSVDSTLMASTATAPVPVDKPLRYVLRNNYPNPFNPTTMIRYDLPEAAAVRLDVFNVKGERVVVLVDKHQPAGTHQVRWDGRNSSGQPVATGVYFYRLKAGSFADTKKMQLLK